MVLRILNRVGSSVSLVNVEAVEALRRRAPDSDTDTEEAEVKRLTETRRAGSTSSLQSGEREQIEPQRQPNRKQRIAVARVGLNLQPGQRPRKATPMDGSRN